MSKGDNFVNYEQRMKSTESRVLPCDEQGITQGEASYVSSKQGG